MIPGLDQDYRVRGILDKVKAGATATVDCSTASDGTETINVTVSIPIRPFRSTTCGIACVC